MFYRDYKITNKWWKRQLSIDVGGKEVLFDNMEELKEYVDDLYRWKQESMTGMEDNTMSKWSEIRCDFFDEEEEKYFVDAWKTDDDNEEGTVIAKLDLADGTVEYLDEDAKTDEYAQEVIKEMLEEDYILTE